VKGKESDLILFRILIIEAGFFKDDARYLNVVLHAGQDFSFK